MAVPATPPVIDTHTHVWPRGLVHAAQKEPIPLEASPADLLATIAASGVIAAIASPAMVHAENEYVLGAAAAVPDRLAAVVGIDPRDAAAVDRIPAHARHGAIGVRVNLGATPLEGPDALAGLDRLVDAAREAGLVIQWTMRLPATDLIERAAARSPDVPQVLDHLGLPTDARDLGALDRIRTLAAIPALTVKLSGMYALSQAAYPYEDTWPWAEGVIAAFGPERTMWASDWPLSMQSASHADHLALVRRLPFLDEAAQRAILFGTAERVWRLAADRGADASATRTPTSS